MALLNIPEKNMTFDLQGALAKTGNQHRMALDWFAAHRGQVALWSEMQAFSNAHSRLVNQAKGIYKPVYTDYALSIRTIQDGPYPDKDVECRPDGSWVLKYFQENIDPTQRDQEATNRGLMKCMDDGIPIGVLIKRKPKPGVEYEVLGLGLVTSWTNGFLPSRDFQIQERSMPVESMMPHVCERTLILPIMILILLTTETLENNH